VTVLVEWSDWPLTSILLRIGDTPDNWQRVAYLGPDFARY
jgi:hypothetical protein